MIANMEKLWAAVQSETKGCGIDGAGDFRQPRSIEDFERAVYRATPRLLRLARAGLALAQSKGEANE